MSSGKKSHPIRPIRPKRKKLRPILCPVRPRFTVEGHSYVSAGIIPITLSNDTYYYLMSFRHDKQCLEDFGGKSDPGDETLVNVALREYAEETGGHHPVSGDDIVAHIPVPEAKYMIYLAEVDWDVTSELCAYHEPGTVYKRRPIWVTKETVSQYAVNPRIKNAIMQFQ
jgi:8-oxo-dGTP pyrophosphatase MutT (NUDIX family)